MPPTPSLLPRRIAFALTALIALLAVACDSEAETADLEVRPVEEIVVGDIEITDLTATSAAVRVETDVEVVCSVVFGTTEAFGSQATDLDMGGGPHRMHLAPLRGLEPDTEYLYRLQGAGSDGTFYVSETRSFRTPPAPEGAAERGPNLAGADAGARIVEASSVFGDSPSWAAEHAIDGDPATEWSSDGDGDEAYLVVELPEPAPIAAVGVWTRTMGSTAQIESFQVVVDGEQVLGPFDLPDASGMHTFELPAPVEGRLLRFEVVSSSGGNTGLVEFAAYGE